MPDPVEPASSRHALVKGVEHHFGNRHYWRQDCALAKVPKERRDVVLAAFALVGVTRDVLIGADHERQVWLRWPPSEVVGDPEPRADATAAELRAWGRRQRERAQSAEAAATLMTSPNTPPAFGAAVLAAHWRAGPSGVADALHARLSRKRQAPEQVPTGEKRVKT